jgi:hypothetical protein
MSPDENEPWSSLPSDNLPNMSDGPNDDALQYAIQGQWDEILPLPQLEQGSTVDSSGNAELPNGLFDLDSSTGLGEPSTQTTFTGMPHAMLSLSFMSNELIHLAGFGPRDASSRGQLHDGVAEPSKAQLPFQELPKAVVEVEYGNLSASDRRGEFTVEISLSLRAVSSARMWIKPLAIASSCSVPPFPTAIPSVR